MILELCILWYLHCSLVCFAVQTVESVVDPCTHQEMGIEPLRLPVGGREMSVGGMQGPPESRLGAAGLGTQFDLDLGLFVAHTDAEPKNRKILMSRPMGKPTICIGENKDADQLRGNREADQRLCFRFTDSTIPLLPISKISGF